MNNIYELEEYVKLDFLLCNELTSDLCLWVESIINRCIYDEFYGVAHVDVYVRNANTFACVHICSVDYAKENKNKISEFILNMFADIVSTAKAVMEKHKKDCNEK